MESFLALPEVEDNFSKIKGTANFAKWGVDAKQRLSGKIRTCPYRF
jgi:hypothetical protein